METPFKIVEGKTEADYGEFIIEPLQPGYGHTIGNALRRVLLTSIQGAAITSARITGVKHKFSTLPGLKENIVDFLLNVKGINFTLTDAKPSAVVKISVKGPKDITAGDLELPDGVEVSNKDHYLGSLSDKKGKLEAEFTLAKGYGYALTEELKVDTLGAIPTDAIFTPIVRVNYTVEATRVGRQTNLDKLVMHVWTNGTVTPKDALMHAAKVLSNYFGQIYEPTSAIASSTDGAVVASSLSEELQRLTVDELDLPTRIYNSLRNGGIETVGQLVAVPRKDLMTMRNMGGKSISIIEEKLREKGVSLPV